MRIATLDRAATEIATAIGLAGSIVAIADDVAPRDLLALPGVPIVSRVTVEGTGDRLVRHDHAALRAATPELIIACSGPPLPPDLVPADAAVVALDPTSLEGVLNAIATIGAMTAVEDPALELVEHLRQRLSEIETRVAAGREAGAIATRVAVLEWLEPPIASGRWIPEQVRRAGGWEIVGSEGGSPRPTSWDELRAVDPEALVVSRRGCTFDALVESWERAERPAGWDELSAVQRGQVFLIDGPAYLTSAGPGLFAGVELLAELLDPAGFAGFAPDAGWLPVD